jgi:uncharacterized protein
MSDLQGRFVWYELMTTDREAAKAFYGNLVGWGAQDKQMPGMIYTILTVDDAPVSGLMDLPAEARKMGAPPGWIGYVAVDDVDAATDRVKSLGGTVHVPPKDIPDVGRFSMVADPQGAVLALFKSSNPGQDQPPVQRAPGHVGWHELLATDWEKAFPFYGELFGWFKAEAVDLGAMGTYQLFASHEQTIGGMFTKPPMIPVPFWLYYFLVDDIDGATERVKAGGGQILNGPMQVPGGDWIVQGMDPQGAMFALVGTRVG